MHQRNTNIVFALCSTLLTNGVPVYIAETLRAPPWMIVTLIALSTVLIAGLQTVVVRLLEPYRRTHALMFCGWLCGSWCALLAIALVAPQGLLLPVLFATTGVYALAELIHDPTSNALAAETAPADTKRNTGRTGPDSQSFFISRRSPFHSFVDTVLSNSALLHPRSLFFPFSVGIGSRTPHSA